LYVPLGLHEMRRTRFITAVFELVFGGLLLLGCSLTNPGGISPTQPVPTPSVTPTGVSNQPGAATSTAVALATVEPVATIPFEPLSFSAADCSYGGEFKTIQAIDEYTIRFELCRPDVAFLEKIAYPSFGVQPREWLEQNGGGGKDSPLLEKPVGTGSFQLQEWRVGEYLRFTAFGDYWGAEKARVPNLVFRWHVEAGQRLLELQTGAVQGIDQPDLQDYPAIQSDPNLKLLFRPSLSVTFLGMNNTYPPFDNQLVRQAIALAIDRKAILEGAFPPGFQAASFFTPCIIPNGCAGEEWYAYNPDKAKELLVAAGYPDGFETQLTYRDVVRGYLPQPERVAKAIQTQLKENLNISADLIVLHSQEFLTATDTGQLPGLFLSGWGADFPDASNFLDSNFGAGATKMLGNPFPDITEPLRQAVLQVDEQTRQTYYVAANKAILEHVPMIPLAHGGWTVPEDVAAAFSQAVQGASVNPFGFERFAGMALPGQDSLIWMQGAEPLSLYCADETDVDSLRACAQVLETLYQFPADGVQVQPGLAKVCEPSANLTVWTCTLHSGVKFHDGSLLDANDVVLSLVVQWDAANSLHKGRTGEFGYFKYLWGAFLNSTSP
jgi:peptide/nickel transport system substrate-binding protein